MDQVDSLCQAVEALKAFQRADMQRRGHAQQLSRAIVPPAQVGDEHERPTGPRNNLWPPRADLGHPAAPPAGSPEVGRRESARGGGGARDRMLTQQLRANADALERELAAAAHRGSASTAVFLARQRGEGVPHHLLMQPPGGVPAAAAYPPSPLDRWQEELRQRAAADPPLNPMGVTGKRHFQPAAAPPGGGGGLVVVELAARATATAAEAEARAGAAWAAVDDAQAAGHDGRLLADLRERAVAAEAGAVRALLAAAAATSPGGASGLLPRHLSGAEELPPSERFFAPPRNLFDVSAAAAADGGGRLGTLHVVDRGRRRVPAPAGLAAEASAPSGAAAAVHGRMSGDVALDGPAAYLRWRTEAARNEDTWVHTVRAPDAEAAANRRAGAQAQRASEVADARAAAAAASLARRLQPRVPAPPPPPPRFPVPSNMLGTTSASVAAMAARASAVRQVAPVPKSRTVAF
jgi:hypothetical protein